MNRIGRLIFLSFLLAYCAISGAQAHGAAQGGRVFALVIGIDDYHYINPLHGAVNDARDVASALETINGSEVRLLLDADASREAVLANWQDLTDLAGEGDILIFHFAGHGGRADAIVEGHEDKDNMFLMVGFDESGPGMAQRLVDNEVGHLLARETEATVFLVADSCYAGGMARQADKRAATDLRAPGVHMAQDGDELADYLRQLGEVDKADLDHVVWLYAQDQNKLTQEISIEGERRGALSYAFANVLRGKADRDGDGRLTIREIKRYVNKTVVRLTERRQRPSVNAGKAFSNVAFPAPGNAKAAAIPATLRIYSDKPDELSILSHVEVVQDRRQADLIYDGERQELIYRTGDKIGQFDQYFDRLSWEQAMQGAVNKWRVMHYLTGFSADHAPDISLGDGPRIYREGDKVRFDLDGHQHGHVVLVNLTNDGTIQVIAPSRASGKGLAAGRLTPGRPTGFEAPVTAPFGADHVLALTAERMPSALLDALPNLNNSRNVEDLAHLLAQEIATGKAGLDWLGLYTKAKGEE